MKIWNRTFRLPLVSVAAIVLLCPGRAALAAEGGGPTLYGFTPFPYEATVTALDKTYEITRKHGQITAIHLDDGIPWYEALNRRPFPKSVESKWKEIDSKRDPAAPVYLGLSPLGTDRETLVRGSEGSSDRDIFKGKQLNDNDVIRAYTEYTRAAMKRFQPAYVNLGIESGELAYRDPKRWPQFEELYEHVVATLRREFPSVKFGISFGLQSLLEAGMMDRVKKLLDGSDYMGLSFYPYMSPFHEKYGMKALPSPPGQWRDPLQKILKLSPIPVAIAETGYSSRPLTLEQFDLIFAGTESLQKAYLEDLGAIASDHRFPFVVWFLPVDYENLFKTIPLKSEADLIWQHIGLFDSKLRAKPALEVWAKLSSGAPEALPEPSADHEVDLSDPDTRFESSEHDRVEVVDTEPSSVENGPATKGVRWSYDYHTGRWQYMSRRLDAGSLSGAATMRLRIRSDRTGPLLVQLEESDGEAFFAVIHPTSSWADTSVRLSDLQLDPEKKRDGLLSKEKVVRIMFADAGAVTEGARGRRSTWISSLRFE